MANKLGSQSAEQGYYISSAIPSDADAVVGLIWIDPDNAGGISRLYVCTSVGPVVFTELRTTVPRALQITVFAPDGDASTGDDKAHFRVDSILSGYNITSVHAETPGGAGITGTLDIQLRNKTQSNADILSTKLTVDSTETGSDTATIPAVINLSEDDMQLNDVIAIDVDAIHSGTTSKGLIITVGFELP